MERSKASWREPERRIEESERSRKGNEECQRRRSAREERQRKYETYMENLGAEDWYGYGHLVTEPKITVGIAEILAWRNIGV